MQRRCEPEGVRVGNAPVRGDDLVDPAAQPGQARVQRRARRDVARRDDHDVARRSRVHGAILPPRGAVPGQASCRLAAVPEPPYPAQIQRVVDAAARKGVTLDVRVFDESTHTAGEAADAVDAELGQIVKSLVFVAPPTAAASSRSCAWSPARTAWTVTAWRP